MKRKILALLLCTAMILTLMPVTAYAEDGLVTGYCGADEDGKNLYFTLDISTGVLDIYGTGDMCGFDYYSTPFYGVDLTRVTVHEGVTSIGGNAFRFNDYLTEVSLPQSLQRIDGDAFNSCSGLESIDLPSGLTYIGNGAFAGCGLKSIDVPESIEVLTSDLFYDCPNLETVTLHSGLKRIWEHAFGACPSLKNLVIPATVEEIRNPFVEDCENLTTIQVEQGNPAYFSDDGILFARNIDGYEDEDWTIPIYGDDILLAVFPPGRGGEYRIPDTVASMKAEAFYTCRKLEHVFIPKTLNLLPDQIWGMNFSGCDRLTSAGPVGSGAAIEFEWDEEIPGDAFQGCDKLEWVVIPEGIRVIGRGAFYYCENLKKVYFPQTLEELSNNQFAYGNNFGLEDIYYGGSEAEWENIPGHNSMAYINARMHYYRNAGGIYIEPIDFGALEINGSGSAKQWFQLQDWFGRPLPDREVRYELPDEGSEFYLISDANGLVGAKISDLTGVGTKTYRLLFSSVNSVPVFNENQEVTVTVNQPSYSQEWSGSVGVGVEGGVGPGVGGEVGPAEAKASLITSTIKLGVKTALSVKDEYENGTRTFTLERGSGISGGLEAETGVDVKIKELSEKAKITPLGTSMGAKVGAAITCGLQIDDYDPGSREQRKQIGAFLLASAVGNASIFGQFIVAAVSSDYNVLTGSSNVTIDAGLDFLKVKKGNAKGSLAALGRTTVYTQSSSLDLSDESDIKQTATNSVVTDVGGGLFSGSYTRKGMSGIQYTVGTGNYVFGRSLSNHKEVSVIKDKNGTVTGASYKVYDGNEKNLSILESVTDTYSKVTYSGDEVKDLVSNSSELKKVSDESIFASIQGAIDELTASGLTAMSEETTKVKSGLDYEFPVSFQIGEKIGALVTFSGEWSYSWVDKTSALFQGEEYPKTESGLTKDEVRNKLQSLPAILEEAIREAAEDLLDDVVTTAGKIKDGIGDTYHKIKKNKTQPYNEWYVRIRSFVLEEIVFPENRAMVVLMDEGDETAAVSSSLGLPCTVEVFTDETCETAITDEELAAAAQSESPVELSIEYTDEMLKAAGIEIGDYEVLPEVMLFRYDPEKDVYVRVDSTEDRASKTVTGSITKNGEYILGVDSVAPILVESEQETYNRTPSVLLTLSDFSEIAEFRLWLEREVESEDEYIWQKVGGDLVTTETFADFYNRKEEQLRYVFEEPLDTEESYRLCWWAKDELGNETGEEDKEACYLTIGADEVIMGQLTVPQDTVTDPEPFTVSLPAAEYLYNVSLHRSVEGETLEPLEMKDNGDGLWVAEIRPSAGQQQMTLTAVGYDYFGNSYPSESAVVNLDIAERSGTLGDREQLQWRYGAGPGQITITQVPDTSPVLGERNAVLAASYDRQGRMLKAAWISAPGETASVGENAYKVKLFWIDENGIPLGQAETAR